MKDIFYELAREAVNGAVVIDGEVWPIAFNTIIGNDRYTNDSNLATLIIDNQNEFFSLLEKYIYLTIESGRKTGFFIEDKERNRFKQIMAYLFVNATVEDFNNPCELLRKNIAFIEDKTLGYLKDGLEIPLDEYFTNSSLIVKEEDQSIYMETPKKIVLTMKNNEGKRCLIAEISYGIREINGEKECIIYSIMSPGIHGKKQIDEDYAKKINRSLFKLNAGVLDNESQEYRDYKDGLSDYYPENISDVSPSQVLAMTTFLSILQREGIHNITVESYLPVRYMSRAIAADKTEDQEVRKEREERNDAIQRNATDKFIRLFRRIMYHMEDLKLFALLDQVPSLGMMLKLGDKEKEINNPILQEINNQILVTEMKMSR